MDTLKAEASINQTIQSTYLKSFCQAQTAVRQIGRQRQSLAMTPALQGAGKFSEVFT